MTTIRPMKAVNYDPDKLRFPVAMSPKIDGVRGINIHGSMTGRTIKPFQCRMITGGMSVAALAGMDGELAAERKTHPDLCRLTTSATSTIEGTVPVDWHVFDLIDPALAHMTFVERHKLIPGRIDAAYESGQLPDWLNLYVVPYYIVNSHEEVVALDRQFLEEGYEGSILRALDSPYKHGTSTLREGYLLRIKHFDDGEFEITGVEEGQHNANEDKRNALGYIERSTHAENMEPNGMVGRLLGKCLQSGEPMVVSPGRLTHKERKLYFEQPELIIGSIGKYKHFAKGAKDKRRFPTFQSFRNPVDL